MNIFVTGGAGYVGSHCVRALCESGHNVLVLDNLSQGHRTAVDSRATFIQGDISETALMRQTLMSGRFDGIVHFAASVNLGESWEKPLDYYQNNLVNTVRLLQVMKEVGIRRLVFSSTAAVYGEPEAVPIPESASTKPVNPYGHTKLAMEWAIADSVAAWGLGACALRYFNAAGAASDGRIGEDRDPEYHIVPVVLSVALGQREQVSIFGNDHSTPDGTCLRDYVHVEDLAQAHLLAIQTQETGVMRCFNVGTGRATSVKQIVDVARAVTGCEIPAVVTPRRTGDPACLLADSSRIQSTLGWKPRYTEIESIIETAWTWHSGHPNGFEE